MRWWLIAFILVIAPAAYAQTDEYAADETVLREQRLPTKGPDLLQIFRDRTPKPDTITQVNKYVARLQSSPYVDRVKASAELRAMGPVVRPLLENLLAEGKHDLETVRRLREVAFHFPAEKDYAAVTAAARLLQRDKPPNGLTTLIDFVPYAINESVRQEVQRALNTLAKAEKAPATILPDTLKDPSPSRRAAAAEAMLRSNGLTARDKISPLLKDENPLVRHQLAMTLVEMNDKSGLPILIRSLTDVPADCAEFALELLYRAGGEKSPSIFYPGKHKAAAFCAAWDKWYTDNQASLDLAKQLARTDLGFTIITTMGIGAKAAANSKVFEVDGRAPDRTVRWEFNAGRYPIDVQILGPNRLLVAEYLDRRVTERDFKGNILWQVAVNLPIGCQRLPDGRTFIVSRQRLVIVDRDGVEVFSHSPQQPSIMAAQRLRNGQIAMVTSGGRCSLIDPQGRELKAFQLGGAVYTLGGNIDVLPGGRILVPLYNQQCVAEFDWDGNKHWTATINNPTSVSRLSNGNTLVTCSLNNRIVEIDRAGKEVWSYHVDGRPFRARRR
ncbi:MAG: hypothetical protein EXR98_08105 [Gemmataceae bacterium]|nr:hypothetical protein [Gemmataceae bacterium]